ncbi:uncharacterized protein DUF3667 [Luteibacter rhizovicinus]|uniref:Uncharacterized protein DUF3667 n=1 Tax=Luteibacter rhizovicinus TaxID=242606 RepID=A0A4R3YUS8_9GAMM|nr:DUF3667 domain-containing protein [Luteibacter rhizovicinus]TCV96166.1 uncharacterized protein DUF3667 [Luteibacter rhizovicinus]
MNELKPAPVLLCANCSTELQGEFCYHCGQSVKSVLRPVSHMIEDVGDLFFHLDERVIHTLPALYFKPGFLTLEYFAGRRVRYIAPFRLMFVFCLLAFFFVHMMLGAAEHTSFKNEEPVAIGNTDAFVAAKTPEEVKTIYTSRIESLEHAADNPELPAMARMGIEAGQTIVWKAANERLIQLGADALPTPRALPGNGNDRDMSTFPVEVHAWWLPSFLNERISEGLVHMKANVILLKNGGPQRQLAARRLQDGVFGVLPQVMFVLLPIFALILKLFYVFRRRLYMEHFIACLHSHAFMFLSLLILTILGMLAAWVRPHAGFVASSIGWVQFAMVLWIPIYLLIMQKRVYRQGWGMTVFKYWLVGSIYFWLLVAALCMSIVISMAH